MNEACPAGPTHSVVALAFAVAVAVVSPWTLLLMAFSGTWTVTTEAPGTISPLSIALQINPHSGESNHPKTLKASPAHTPARLDFSSQTTASSFRRPTNAHYEVFAHRFQGGRNELMRPRMRSAVLARGASRCYDVELS